MDSNTVGVQKHLKGVDSPANSEGSAPTAESNDVPSELIEQLRSLGNEDFSGPDQIMTALRRS